MEGLTIGSVISGIVASLILIAAGWFFRKTFVDSWRNRYFRTIWKQYLQNSQANVVISTRQGPKYSSTPRVSLAEVQAFQRLERVSANLGMNFILQDSTCSLRSLSENNIVLLGGPKANAVTESIWDEVSERVPYTISLEPQKIISSNIHYEPVVTDGAVEVDYSLVVKVRRTSGKYVFLFAGCHGYGTAGSTQLVSDPELARELANRVGDRDFVAIVKSSIKDGIVDNVQIESVLSFA